MFRIINRLILFFSLIMLILGSLYIIGNNQNYADSTLRTIVYTDQLFSLVQAVLIAYAIILMAVTIIKTKNFKTLLYLFHYAGAFFITAVSLSISSVINFIQTL